MRIVSRGKLPGGIQQRIALVWTLIHDPALRLMDEPFGVPEATTLQANPTP